MDFYGKSRGRGIQIFVHLLKYIAAGYSYIPIRYTRGIGITLRRAMP